jgi:excisionase family DNA binding protein
MQPTPGRKRLAPTASPLVPSDDLKLYRVGEAAEILGVSVDVVRRWVHEGRLPVRHINGRNWRVTRADMAALIETLGGSMGSRWSTSPAGNEPTRAAS